MSNPKGLFDLPSEVLNIILQLVLSDGRRTRKAWAIRASTICKSFHEWVLPIIWEQCEVSQDTRMEWAMSHRQQKHSKKRFWQHLAKRFSVQKGPYLKVLIVQGTELNNRNYRHFLRLLSNCPDLIALALGDWNVASIEQFGDEAYEEPQSHSSRIPWQFDPRSLSFSSMFKLDRQRLPLSLPRLERIMLMDSTVGITYDHYANLLFDPITKSSVCPNLTSACLLMRYEGGSIELNDKFVDAMVTFCANHKLLRHLELHFKHSHDESEDRLDDEQFQHGVSMIRSLILKANVSVTLHFQPYCEALDMDCQLGETHFEAIGSHSLRASVQIHRSSRELWKYKLGKLSYWCQEADARFFATFDNFDLQGDATQWPDWRNEDVPDDFWAANEDFDMDVLENDSDTDGQEDEMDESD